ncbi:DUF3099 domain-containing protein [Kocuria sp. HSID16901]|uniref:DUF3099 domain-containing protein n=1 Tax=Kocuria sp. HSID16901 TaxID=2419505 RepID=UPI00069E8A66|nr:DUF3099 domain-containing protein [Kocuria sp. HSID16901]
MSPRDHREKSDAHDEPQDVHTITGAQAPHSEGIDHRMKRYALQMGLRIVCLIVAVAFDGWIRWVAVVGVVVLPWVAVVLANGNDRAEVRDVSYDPGRQPRELIPGQTYSAEESRGHQNPDDGEQNGDDISHGSPDEAPSSPPSDDVIDGEYRTGHQY